MADEEPPRRSGWEIPWGYFFELTLALILLGFSYVASFLFEWEWNLAHYLTLAAVILVLAGATMVYRRSRQILP